MRKKQNIITLDLKISFNDICMREMGLDVTDDDKMYLYHVDTETILKYNEKFLKYPEDEYTLFRSDEIELNLLRNSRIMDSLVSRYLHDFLMMKNIEITAFYHSTAERGKMGYCAFTYMLNGASEEYKSKEFKNESVRMLYLVCRLNKSTHLYDFNMFDIVEDF